MKVKIDGVKEGGILFFRVEGRIDQSNHTIVQNWMEEQLGKGEKWFLGDLSELNYISSAGLGFLLYAAKTLIGIEGGLVIYNLKDEINKLFQLTGLSEVINIAKTKEDALKALKA